jgi:FkbM family methyltransferase
MPIGKGCTSMCELEALLAEGAESACARERSAFDSHAIASSGAIVLCGAGGLGRRTLAGLRRHGITPLAFADNNPARWGSTIDGIAIMPPEEAVQRFGESAAFVVTVWGAFGKDRMADRLGQYRRLGARSVVSFVPLYWKFPDGLAPHYGFDLPHNLHHQASEVRAAFDLWDDEASRKEYVSQVRWRLLGDFEALADPANHNIYFPPDLCQLLPDEVFVDCGAFDGDTVNLFLRECRGRFGKIVAFEPDSHNFARLREAVGNHAAISLYHAATGACRSKVRLVAEGGPGSAIGDGDEEVDCVALDEALQGCHPTYLKMDIEGAELDTLAGARQTIQSEAPVLAICCYHRQDHLWKIPLFIHSLNAGYRFYLRPHDIETFDLVCYAIPPHRAIGYPTIQKEARPAAGA